MTDWRGERDNEGFPVCNEDRDGDLFTDAEYGVVYVCQFVEGLGWSWVTLGKTE